MHSNYLDKNMMYLADAEIDETAFNSFFGSSVLEYAKFYTNTYVQAFERPDALGSILWGAAVKRTPVSLRKWTQYIAVAQELIEKDTTMRGLAADQVRERTKHFYRTMSPEAFLEVRAPHWRPAASHAASSHLGPACIGQPPRVGGAARAAQRQPGQQGQAAALPLRRGALVVRAGEPGAPVSGSEGLGVIPRQSASRSERLWRSALLYHEYGTRTLVSTYPPSVRTRLEIGGFCRGRERERASRDVSLSRWRDGPRGEGDVSDISSTPPPAPRGVLQFSPDRYSLKSM